eukprot:TRINITY_DN40951_c0_g1_i1.p1 TRINITY_DN40951_c0_g1~~TRINITY_DN40951_c0_g1_i1.p1  ORF type:complete len:291 (+),score=7.74 TRINITY_DN40951_c0_g1_i1:37-873(+)
MANPSEFPFGVFFRSQPDVDSYFSFKDFFKVFLLGDIQYLLDHSAFGHGRSVADTLDPAFLSDPERRLKYTGDPVKLAMLAQVIRRFPYITAIPAIFSLALLIASFSKFTIPFIRRISNILDKFTSDSSRKKREYLASEGIRHIPGMLKGMLNTLANGVEAIEFLALENIEKQEGFSHPIARSRRYAEKRFLSYDERKAKFALDEISDIGAVIKTWLESWVRLLPRLANCSGQLAGCFIRYQFWATPCKPWGPITNCFSLFGEALGTLADLSFRFTDK